MSARQLARLLLLSSQVRQRGAHAICDFYAVGAISLSYVRQVQPWRELSTHADAPQQPKPQRRLRKTTAASHPAVEDVAVMSRSHLLRKAKAWLVDQCFQRGLDCEGNKELLVARLLEWQDSLTPEQLVGKVAEGISKQAGASAASSSAPEPSGGSTAAGASTKGQVPTSVAAGQAQQQQQQAEQEQESEPEPEPEQEQVAADAQQAQQRSRREELAAGGGQQLLTLAASAGSLPAAQLADLVWALANTGTDDALAWWKVISAAAQQIQDMSPHDMVEVACCVANMHCTDQQLCVALAARVRADVLSFSRPELKALLGALRLMQHELDAELQELLAQHLAPPQAEQHAEQGAGGGQAQPKQAGAAPCPLRMIGMVR